MYRVNNAPVATSDQKKDHLGERRSNEHTSLLRNDPTRPAATRQPLCSHSAATRQPFGSHSAPILSSACPVGPQHLTADLGLFVYVFTFIRSGLARIPTKYNCDAIMYDRRHKQSHLSIDMYRITPRGKIPVSNMHYYTLNISRNFFVPT